MTTVESITRAVHRRAVPFEIDDAQLAAVSFLSHPRPPECANSSLRGALLEHLQSGLCDLRHLFVHGEIA